MPATMLRTPVLVTANVDAGPPEVNPVMAIPSPAVGVTDVITRRVLSNIELPRITFHGLRVAPRFAVPLGTILPFDFQDSFPSNKKLTNPPVA